MFWNTPPESATVQLARVVRQPCRMASATL